jgi:hypothetical protein
MRTFPIIATSLLRLCLLQDGDVGVGVFLGVQAYLTTADTRSTDFSGATVLRVRPDYGMPVLP